MGTDPLKLDKYLRKKCSKVKQYSKYPFIGDTKGDAVIIVFKWRDHFAAHCIAGVSEGGPSRIYKWYNTGLGIDGQEKSVKEVHEKLNEKSDIKISYWIINK